MTNKTVEEVPTQMTTERLILRSYAVGDGKLLFEASQKNRTHLQRFESGNVLMEIDSLEAAEKAAQELVAGWANRRFFFLAGIEKGTGQFAVQIYIGAINWELPEFELGYIADVEHEGMGFVTEAVKASLDLIFGGLNAQRVTIHCSDANLRSQRVAERCGFVQEGYIRGNERNPDGTFGGQVIYGLLRSGWAALASLA